MFQRAAIRSAAAAVAVAAGGAAGSASYSASSPSPGGVTVTAGDTLWAIAAAHGVTVDQLAAANAMSPSDLLMIGRHLSIPTAGSGRAPTPVVAATPASGTDTSGPTTTAPTPATNANFCATTSFYQGPYGQLPSYLVGSPDRLALRPVMVRWADTYGVSPALVEAVAWQESGWQQGVVSPDGAVGIGQVLPATGSFVDTYLLGANLNIHSASDNIRMESAFLAYLVRQVGNSPCLVAAAYYQGPAALAANGVYPESQQYVRDVLALETEFS